MTGELEDPLLLGTTGHSPSSAEDDLLGIGNKPSQPSTANGEKEMREGVVSQPEEELLGTAPDPSTSHSGAAAPSQGGSGAMPSPVCCHCGGEIGKLLSTTCDAGILHNECVAAYRRQTTERCAHCQNVLRGSRVINGTSKLHPECVASFKAGKVYVPPRKVGMLKKFAIGRSTFGRKNWQDRFVILSSEYRGLAYFESEADAMAYEAGSREKPPKGTVALSRTTSRLITMPTFKQHPYATSASKELIIVFQEDSKERKLLLQFTSWDERCAWLAVLETYIHTVDDLNDYEDPR